MKVHAMTTHKSVDRLASGWETLNWKPFSVKMTGHYVLASFDFASRKDVPAKPATFAIQDESLVRITPIKVGVTEYEDFRRTADEKASYRAKTIDQFYYLVEWETSAVHWWHWGDGILTVATAQALLAGTARIDTGLVRVFIGDKVGDWKNDAAFWEFAKNMTTSHPLEGHEFGKILKKVKK